MIEKIIAKYLHISFFKFSCVFDTKISSFTTHELFTVYPLYTWSVSFKKQNKNNAYFKKKESAMMLQHKSISG